MAFKTNELRLGKNDIPLEDPRLNEVTMRIDSLGNIFTKPEGQPEVQVGGGGGGVFAYSGSNALYGTNNAEGDTGSTAIQIGSLAKATGDSSIAIGNSADSSNTFSAVVIGSESRGTHAGVAIGNKAIADINVGLYGAEYYSNVSIGYNSQCFSRYASSVAIGHNCTIGAPGLSGFAFDGSVAIGGEATSDPNGGVAIGYKSSAGRAAVAIGKATASAQGSLAMMGGASSQASNSISIGVLSRVSTGYDYSVAVGNRVQATAASSFALGTSNTNKIEFKTWVPVIGAGVASTHTLPVEIGGVVYNILLSNV